MNTAAYSLRTVARTEAAARTVANSAAAVERRALRAEVRATTLRADWTNMLAMLAAGGRPVPAELVWATARAGKATAAELLAAFTSGTVSGAMPAAAQHAMMHPAAVAISAADAVDADPAHPLRCAACSARLAARAHLAATTRFGETFRYCTAACRGSFGGAR